MNEPTKIIVISTTIESQICPTIICGVTDNGWIICARYMWGHLSIRIDNPNPLPNRINGYWIYNKQLDPSELDDCISYDDLREITEDMIKWPDEPTQTRPAGTDP